MNFFEAVKALEDGEKIKNTYWTETKYIYLDKTLGFVKNQDDQDSTLSLSHPNEDIWEIYREPEEFFSFVEACAMLKAGLKMKRKNCSNKILQGTITPILFLVENGIFHAIPICIDDVLAEDWVEVKNV